MLICFQAGFTGLGVGAAMYGLKPIVEFMTFNFAMQVSYNLFSLLSYEFDGNVLREKQSHEKDSLRI